MSTCQYSQISSTIKLEIVETSKEKHSLTRKLVGYRKWTQRWCKKRKGTRFLEKKNETKILYLALLLVLLHFCLIFLFPKPVLFTPPLPPIHIFSLENVFLYLFIYLILEDVLPGDSKAIGIIGAL